MKKNIILVVTLLIIVAVIIGAILFLNSKNNEQANSSKMISFEYSSGSYFSGYREYSLVLEDNTVHYTARGLNGVDLNIDKYLNPSAFDKIQEIIVKNNLMDWNEFDNKDSSVSDGRSFNLTIEYEDGTEINASAYGTKDNFPNNFDTVDTELINCLDNL